MDTTIITGGLKEWSALFRGVILSNHDINKILIITEKFLKFFHHPRISRSESAFLMVW